MANTEAELKQKLKELIESIVDGDDYTVQTADNAIRALSALKVLKRPASPVPPHFRCPLSGHLMTDPVILATGQVFFLFFFFFPFFIATYQEPVSLRKGTLCMYIPRKVLKKVWELKTQH